MTYRSEYLIALILLFSGSIYSSGADKKQTAEKHATSTQTNAQPDETERVFVSHCARCHMPPMALSQRTTGTVVMHMRMRARLSQRDEQLLLKYLAP